ncbi:MAG: hypothetical protein MUP11_02025, partial [Anaerolineales bacterium]|nr:hypothetical protein [Anaerolineales bacterium]
LVDYEILLIKTKPLADQLTQYNLPFRDNIELEFELEGLLDMAGGLIEQSRTVTSIEELDFYGYSMIEEGSLNDNQVLYSFFPVAELDEFLEEGNNLEEKQEFISYIQTRPAYKRHELHYRYYKYIPDIFAPDILLMIDKYNLGCDITSGLGCAIPDGCNKDTGEGCEFSSGCNIITRDGCERARLNCIVYTNCDAAPCGARPVITHFCKPRVRNYCDPDVAGDCDQYLNTGTSLPIEVVQNPELAGQPLCDPNDQASLENLYNEDFWESQAEWVDDDYGDEDIEWCTCTAAVPPGYPPPPSSMDMTYRCWCSDPGASK